MKIFNLVSQSKTKNWMSEDGEKVLIPSRTIYQIEVNQEAIKFLQLNGGSTVDRITYLILHFYNAEKFPLGNFDLVVMIRNADEERQELILSIIEMCTAKYKDECFRILDEIAPLFINDFISN